MERHDLVSVGTYTTVLVNEFGCDEVVTVGFMLLKLDILETDS